MKSQGEKAAIKPSVDIDRARVVLNLYLVVFPEQFSTQHERSEESEARGSYEWKF